MHHELSLFECRAILQHYIQMTAKLMLNLENIFIMSDNRLHKTYIMVVDTIPTPKTNTLETNMLLFLQCINH